MPVPSRITANATLPDERTCVIQPRTTTVCPTWSLSSAILGVKCDMESGAGGGILADCTLVCGDGSSKATPILKGMVPLFWRRHPCTENTSSDRLLEAIRRSHELEFEARGRPRRHRAHTRRPVGVRCMVAAAPAERLAHELRDRDFGEVDRAREVARRRCSRRSSTPRIGYQRRCSSTGDTAARAGRCGNLAGSV